LSESYLLTGIQYQPDQGLLQEKLHIRPGSSRATDLDALAREAQTVARPKAFYKMSYIESREGDTLVIDGARLSSRVLRVNLESAHRVFPYVATCGREMEAWAETQPDMLARFSAELMMEHALGAAINTMFAHIIEHFHPGKTSTMNPGSLEDWPLTQQQALFALLGDTQVSVGVELTDSYLMRPRKSVSGIVFPTEIGFESCMLCPRENCPGRRAPYQPEMSLEKYGMMGQ
jgi:hypothetical protein